MHALLVTISECNRLGEQSQELEVFVDG